ncbi:MAG: Mur ligase family protein [Patescibacteria group bacterium]
MGERVVGLSTIELSLPEEKRLNNKKMTMAGRTFIQRFLRRGADAGCRYAIVETTSEGVVQSRHRGIAYDVAVLTNLYPEHIESHGSFDAYKKAKIRFFHSVMRLPMKRIDGVMAPRLFIANAESPHTPDFLWGIEKYHARCFLFSTVHAVVSCACCGEEIIWADDISPAPDGLSFTLFGQSVQTRIVGRHNVYNILAAVSVLIGLGWQKKRVCAAVAALTQPPGRLERIDEGQPFTVIVDYAFEPVAMQALYAALAEWRPNRIIHVFGSTGGGRDVARRFTVGAYVGAHADVCIVTDEDPYDDDPLSIINDVADAAAKTGKKDGETLFRIPDRKEAILRAFSLAQKGDVVLITGKGSEQAMIVKGKKIPWDDRTIAREFLMKKMYGSTS